MTRSGKTVTVAENHEITGENIPMGHFCQPIVFDCFIVGRLFYHIPTAHSSFQLVNDFKTFQMTKVYFEFD